MAIVQESDPYAIRGDNDLPFDACCGNCSHMEIQLGGDF